MNELIETIRESFLSLVSEAIKILPELVFAIILLFVTKYIVKLANKIIRVSAIRFIKSISLQLLLLQVTSVAIWTIGILIACTLIFPGLRLGDIIGLLGLSSVAVGFAFQDIFKNFLAGILLLLNEPFRVKDQIIVADYEGTVEAINIRSTEIRTYQDERVVIPNAIVFTNPVQVLTHYKHRRTDLKIGLDYRTPLSEARQVLLSALAKVEGVLSNPPAEIDVTGFEDSAIELVVHYWTLPQKVQVRRIQTEVMIALKQACDEAGLNIPFPIRTVYFSNQTTNQNEPQADDQSNGHQNNQNDHQTSSQLGDHSPFH